MMDVVLVLILVLIVVSFGICVLSSPYKYPYYNKQFDVSGKRNPDVDTLIEDFINHGGFREIQQHQNHIDAWKYRCEQEIERSFLRSLRWKQYTACLDDNQSFQFTMCRSQTRYKQQNHQKWSYKVMVPVGSVAYSYKSLLNKYNRLKSIGFEATLKDYHSKEQRKLMTKQLREQIARRDNYTCKLCGKYMPDGVGLQIDHIVPVAKGGKTVASNLQVLCSKCNGRKSAK